jgi:flagellar hook-length control protein FliK
VIAIVPQLEVQPAQTRTSASASAPRGSFSDLMGQMSHTSSSHPAAKPTGGDASQAKESKDEKTNPTSAAAKSDDHSSKIGADKKDKDPQPATDDDASTNAIAQLVPNQIPVTNVAPAVVLPSMGLTQQSGASETEFASVSPLAGLVENLRLPPEDPKAKPDIPQGSQKTDIDKKADEVTDSTGPLSSNSLADLKPKASLPLPEKMNAAAVPPVKTASSVDRPQSAEAVRDTHVEAPKAEDKTNGTEAPQDNSAPTQPDPTAIAVPDASAVSLAPTIPDNKTVETKTETLRPTLIDSQLKSSVKPASSLDIASPQATVAASPSKDEIGARTGKDEKKDQDSTGSFKDSQPDLFDNQTTLSTSQSHLPAPPVAHAPVSSSTVSEHTLSPKDSSTGAALPQTAEAGTQTEVSSAAAASILHSAKLLERVGQSELRVGIQGGEFGNIDIRTSMTRNQFTAEIAVEHGELGRMLAADLPSLQNKLAEHRIPQANLVLQNQMSGNSSGSEQRPGSWQRTPPAQSVVNSYATEERIENGAPAATEIIRKSTGLDIHM